MDFITGALAIGNFLAANEAEKQRNQMMKEAAAKRNSAIKILAKQAEAIRKDYEDWLANGGANLNDELAMSDEKFTNTLQTDLNKNLLTYGLAGGKPGESVGNNIFRQTTANSILERRREEARMRREADAIQQARLAQVYGAEGALANAKMNFGNTLAGEAGAMPANSFMNVAQNLASQYLQDQQAKSAGKTAGQVSNPSRPAQLDLTGVNNNLKGLASTKASGFMYNFEPPK
jgi:hypothetical protein